MLPALAAGPEWHFADGREVVDDLTQHLQLLPNGGQLLRVRGQVVAVAATGLAAGKKENNDLHIFSHFQTSFNRLRQTVNFRDDNRLSLNFGTICFKFKRVFLMIEPISFVFLQIRQKNKTDK